MVNLNDDERQTKERPIHPNEFIENENHAVSSEHFHNDGINKTQDFTDNHDLNEQDTYLHIDHQYCKQMDENYYMNNECGSNEENSTKNNNFDLETQLLNFIDDKRPTNLMKIFPKE